MTKADEYCTQLRNENRILLAQLECAKEQVATSILLCADHQALLVKNIVLQDAVKAALMLLESGELLCELSAACELRKILK